MDRERIADILKHFRQLEEIDNTSYQAGVNADRNIDKAINQILELIGYAHQPEPRRRRPEQPGLDGEAAGWVFKSNKSPQDKTDRERTIYELCRFYEEGLCSSPETPKRTNECIKGECVVFEGYTRQPEPSPDRVKAVADIIKLCLDTDPFDPAGGMPEEIARSILSLFPEPVLTADELRELRQCFINNSYHLYDKLNPDAPILKKLETLILAHNQQQIKGE